MSPNRTDVEYKITPIVERIKTNKLRTHGHVMRREDESRMKHEDEGKETEMKIEVSVDHQHQKPPGGKAPTSRMY